MTLTFVGRNELDVSAQLALQEEVIQYGDIELITPSDVRGSA